MLIEQQIIQYRALDEWFDSSLGSFVANEFSNQLKSVNDYLRGETLLQLGNCGDNPWLSTLNFKRKWIAAPLFLSNAINLECSFNQIPLSRNSLDCVVAPLTLEPYGSSLSLIDEIDRILKPMGFIILLSINPWSLWGGAMKCGLLHCYNDRAIKMRSPLNVNRIFLQRGYRQCALSSFCYIPPVNSKSLIKKFTFFDEVGKMLWPFPSGFYCYIAQKFEAVHPSLLAEPVLQPITKKYKSTLQPATN
ncbi:methyltransferase [Legionella antarctica]|uniref:Methyltransferase n=1 Tax=Legionella antarctica TaxID=2708020 RepID=A0A6F8T5M3_9GAMM|nr:methyltransferase domain-containing protein [Legionella antarctica]BCA95708.1 methyltransferase [Legionella antarctica]